MHAFRMIHHDAVEGKIAALRRELDGLQASVAYRHRAAHIESAEWLRVVLGTGGAFPSYTDAVQACGARRGLDDERAKAHVDSLIGRCVRGERLAYGELLGYLDVEPTPESWQP